jgi:hypothetical protein
MSQPSIETTERPSMPPPVPTYTSASTLPSTPNTSESRPYHRLNVTQQDKRKMARTLSKPMPYPVQLSTHPGYPIQLSAQPGGEGFSQDPNQPRVKDLTNCTIRRSKSDKNYGRMYHWNPHTRAFVAWVENVTQDVMDSWWSACDDREKGYWANVFPNPCNVDVAQNAASYLAKIDAIDAEKPLANEANLTYAPYLGSRSFVDAANSEQAKEVQDTHGFVNVDQAVDQAREAKYNVEYRKLYRDLLFYLTQRPADYGQWAIIVDALKKTEIESILSENMRTD